MNQDVETVFDVLKPRNTVDVLISFSLLRIKHEKLFYELSQKVLNNINFYQRDLPMVLISYGISKDFAKVIILLKQGLALHKTGARISSELF